MDLRRLADARRVVRKSLVGGWGLRDGFRVFWACSSIDGRGDEDGDEDGDGKDSGNSELAGEGVCIPTLLPHLHSDG